ncbi:plant UBX domain-containing protein 4-like [Bidens hawaiensis]|uniref:plant UBX domain-containing protein 4-like n=1 Tax=Bidens hawaiensis TaxID=980011 RepID=UPI004049298A
MEDSPAINTTTGGSNPHDDIITAFSDITSASREEATFFLESHNYDLDSAVTTFFEANDDPITHQNPNPNADTHSPLSSPSRSRSASPPPSHQLASDNNPYNLRSRNTGADMKASGSRSSGRIRTFADLNRPDDDSGSDSDGPQEYFTGGQKSGMLVQDPTKRNDVEALFNQLRQAGAEERTPEQFQPSSSSRSFSGRGRLLSGDTTSPPPQQVQPQSQPQPQPPNVTITFWTNGFTVNDGPLGSMDDPQNTAFLESLKKGEYPEELKPPPGSAPVPVSVVRKLEEYPVQKHRKAAFVGVGRTLGSSGATEAVTPLPVTAAPTLSAGLVVDDTLPSTSIQLRLADGTRMLSRFNNHHTIRNIRSFIDASRPGGYGAYQLLTMGFPPKQLNDLNLTIEEAGLANSVVIQKL